MPTQKSTAGGLLLTLVVLGIPLFIAVAQAAAGASQNSVIGSFTVFLILSASYFIPTFVARNRKHKDAAAITILNVFLGWTFIGWIVALVWSFTGNVHQPAA